MLQDIINERLGFIDRIITTFKTELEPNLPKKFLRGPLQRQLLKKFNLALTGPRMRSINEAMAILGYKKITHDGWSYYKKVD